MTAFLKISLAIWNPKDPLSCSFLDFIPLKSEVISLLEQVYSRHYSGVLWSAFSIAQFPYSPTRYELESVVLICPLSLISISVYFQEIALTAHLRTWRKAQTKEKIQPSS